jgi:hypothetical protein
MAPTAHAQDFHTEWCAKEYLQQYYATAAIPSDELAIYNAVLPYLQTARPHFARALDFGCGPTVHHVIPFIPYVQELHLADYVPENLAAIQHWLQGDPEAHNWDMYIKGVLQLEGAAHPGSLALDLRKTHMRRKITQLKQGNLHWPHPLADQATYPLVLSFYCADSATASKAEWRLFMRRLFRLVEPGGTLILAALHNATQYTVGTRYFPSAQVTEHDLSAVLRDENFDEATLDLRVVPVTEWAADGFERIIIARAQKKPAAHTERWRL